MAGESSATSEDLVHEFDHSFVHYFPSGEAGVIQHGDKALCGVAAIGTRGPRTDEYDLPHCPICEAMLEELDERGDA